MVSPFIKALVIERLLGCVSDQVMLTCVTRWWPQDIAAGVSDLRVWELLRDSPRWSMFLRHDLHAKLYGADDRYLVGSANLTSKALGYGYTANLEILVKLEAGDAAISSFLRELYRGTVEVNDEVFEAMTGLVAALPPVSVQNQTPALERLWPEVQAADTSIDLVTWVPRTRQPEDLALSYDGKGDALSHATARAAASDLTMLQMPLGLTPTTFRRAVGSLLLQTPIAHAVDTFIAAGERRFGEISNLMDELNPHGSGSHDWQTLLRWFFTSNRVVTYIDDRTTAS